MEKTEPAVHEEPVMCTKKEKIGHAIGVLGHDSAYTLWAMWMTPFLTDIVQLPAAILGGLLAFGRVFDGVNDIMMGSLQTEPVPNLDVSARGFSGLARCSVCVWH